jgi:hypothetical protein
VQVGTAGEEPNLSVVPPSVAVVADVKGLVEVANQVDDEPQRDVALFDRSVRVPEDVQELGELFHDASLPWVRA